MVDRIVIDARSSRSGIGWRELWRYRELLLVLVQRDIAVRYQETVLGVAWAILQPLAMMVVFSIVFGWVAHGSSGVPYPLFVFTGLLPWLFFANAVTSAGQSVLNSRGLISKVYFPRLAIPLAAIGAPLVDFGLCLLLLLVLMWIYSVPVTAGVLWVLPLTLAIAVFAAGIGSLAAALMVRYRDIRHALPFVVSVWLFLTPVIYPSAYLPQKWQWLLYLNPMAGIVEGMRSAWFGLPFNDALIAASMASGLALTVLGVWYFRSVEREFADIL